jgi:hypothetical protein
LKSPCNSIYLPKKPAHWLANVLVLAPEPINTRVLPVQSSARWWPVRGEHKSLTIRYYASLTRPSLGVPSITNLRQVGFQVKTELFQLILVLMLPVDIIPHGMNQPIHSIGWIIHNFFALAELERECYIGQQF